MQYEQLGSTGAFVSRVALGTMTFGGAGTQPWDLLGALDLKAADRLVGMALDAGVNLVDTADIYAGGECEEFLGQILAGRRRDVVLATKLYARMGPGPNDAGLSRIHVMRSLEDSLRRLRTDHVDLYQIHSFDPVTPLEETLSALDDAVRQGKVRYVGASNLAAWQLAKALGVSERHGLARFVSLQSYYSLVGRDLDREILPLIREERLGMLVYSPLAGGFLSGKFGREGVSDASARQAQVENPPIDRERGYDVIDVMRAVAARHGIGVATVALAWVLAQPGVTSVIVGAKRPDQLTENLGAADVQLTEQDLAELEAVSALPPSYPGWVQAGAHPSRLPQG
ncbi:aldo/keto reductase [Nonomuraea jiangxiensis]|uniref:Predicted oxidoreductase n=1 Tax=Nonomuraea jiangxiensis TaxID=633440 RepID=A0A1G7ZU36_9ACTN|nr:aldo/keto reductase [Nonomuraea jiangxiensis]SDH12164.1 Predicted oxidoreductase [Nonomuraea jiangxiensis]